MAPPSSCLTPASLVGVFFFFSPEVLGREQVRLVWNLPGQSVLLSLFEQTYTINLIFVLFHAASRREGGGWWISFSRHQPTRPSFCSNDVLLFCQKQWLYQRVERLDLQPITSPLILVKTIFQFKTSPSSIFKAYAACQIYTVVYNLIQL